MGSRIGRRNAQATYPLSRQLTTIPLGRNSAFGPPTDTTITSTANPPTQAVSWTLIENGETPGVNVTATPRSSGTFVVTAVVNVNNPTGGAIPLTAVVTINGVVAGQISGQFVPSEEPGSVALQTVLTGNPLGVPVNFGVRVSGTGLSLSHQFTTITAQEVPPVTG